MTSLFDSAPAYRLEEPTAADAAAALQLEDGHRRQVYAALGDTEGKAAALKPLAGEPDLARFETYHEAFARRLTDSGVYMRVIRQSGGLVVAFLDADLEPGRHRVGALHVAGGHCGQGLGSALLRDYEANVASGQTIRTEMPVADTTMISFFAHHRYEVQPRRLNDRHNVPWLEMIKHKTLEVA